MCYKRGGLFDQKQRPPRSTPTYATMICTMTQTSKLFTFIILFICSFLIASYFLFSKYLDTDIKKQREEIIQLKNSETLLSQMTLEEKVGQMFLMGFWGTEPDYYITKMIKERHIGGVILFKYNAKDKEQLIQLSESLQLLSEKVPLFISIDQEGGIVSRLGTDIVSEIIPQSEIKTEKEAYNISKKRAKELKDLGISMNFSPVLDNIQKEDSFLYDRSFRTDISSLGSKMISGYTDGEVIAVPKHFPGHPDNLTDSHEALPEVNISQTEFDEYASQFKEIVLNEDTQAIMVGHILFKQIDAKNPSSLSSKIINEILRKEYGFNGVVITDDMQMGALTESYTISEAALKAVTAGNDILIYSGEPEQQAQAYNTILNAVKNGEIAEERINESVLRILTLKANIFNL